MKKTVGYFFGFTRWKRGYIAPFFTALDKKVFCSTLQEALRKGLDLKSNIYIWGKKEFLEVEEYAKKHDMQLFRVEDGFIRSVSLGSDLTKPFSLVVDSRGIYFDPTTSSDLENILQTTQFSSVLLERATLLREYIVENKLSKYNIYKDESLDLEDKKPDQKIIFVPGQVEDDASIFYGADGTTNLTLLEMVRENRENAYIIYKPHPDVLVGNRVGNIADEEALKYCDKIVKKASIDSVMEVCDEVHTLTSLVGFESLLRGKEVHTYGMPFYAGWGLTHDHKHCSRRERKLSLEMLIAATLILYPYYINPKTDEACEIEEVLRFLDEEKQRYNHNLFYRYKTNIRNLISRKLQLLLKVILGE